MPLLKEDSNVYRSGGYYSVYVCPEMHMKGRDVNFSLTESPRLKTECKSEYVSLSCVLPLAAFRITNAHF